ncbi:MAG: hypothetical protein ACRCXZ_05060 [Patescibacteria group bacterium]
MKYKKTIAELQKEGILPNPNPNPKDNPKQKWDKETEMAIIDMFKRFSYDAVRLKIKRLYKKIGGKERYKNIILT